MKQINLFSMSNFNNRENLKSKTIFENTIQIMKMAMFISVLGFFVAFYLLFSRPDLYILVFFVIGFWSFAVFLIFIALFYFLKNFFFKDQKLDSQYKMSEYLNEAINQSNVNSEKSKLVWKRGYQSLWIEVIKKV